MTYVGTDSLSLLSPQGRFPDCTTSGYNAEPAKLAFYDSGHGVRAKKRAGLHAYCTQTGRQTYTLPRAPRLHGAMGNP